MYLKEIVTNGFKSFADKMTISLDDETTCIVGPNGSGKSNIVDAVRWVLGEQSVKSLRGDGSMSDVIFAGSASRKAKNAASVELVFDNQDHYLNLDYTEVSVKRRVFRSGENEYFINQEKCRLKDIITLFLDSGVGKESFNIIGQGEVQRILSESKEERRLIFEEAAGILKYKKRKEEALRKLDKTHVSLERLSDIITELEAQVMPLKEQSKQAREYLALKEQLETLEIALLAYDIYTLSSEEETLKKKQQSLVSEVENLVGKGDLTSGQEVKEKTNLDKLEKDLSFHQQELLKVTEDVASLQGEIALLKAERSHHDQNAKEAQLQALHTTVASLHKDSLSLKTKISLQEKEQAKKQEIISLRQKEIASSKLEKKQLEQNYGKIERDLFTIKNKIEILKTEEEKGSYLPSTVKRILNEKNLQGIYDTIGNVVTTKEKYAKALDIALSSSRNFIIVKDEKSATDAIGYLKNERLGRATFFPISVINKRTVDIVTKRKLEQIEGYLGVLADLVVTKELYQNIIYNQLGLVLVAEDMESALIISKEIDKRYKVITLSGDVINVGGSMTGGGNAKSRSPIMISQEISSLKKEQTFLESSKQKVLLQLNQHTERITTLEEMIYQQLREGNLLTEEIKTKQAKLKEIDETLTQNKKSLETLESDDTQLESKTASLIELFYQRSAYKEKLEMEVLSLQEEIVSKKKVVEELEADTKYKNAILRKKEEEKQQIEIELSRLDVKLTSYLDILTTEYSITYEKARQNYSLEVEHDQALAKVNNYKANIKRLGMVNLAAIEEYERVGSRYEFLLHQREDLVAAETTLLEIMDEMDEVMKEEFLKTFQIINSEFQKVFKELFQGGSAHLQLADEENLLTTGIEIIASPPGKKLSTINLLSGGEKTLTAISLLFAILNVRVVPFCIFDEVEAALDEANVDRFGTYLSHYKDKTQFLIITHKKKTMEYADTLYGITMQESGVSKLVSVKLDSTKEYL